MKDHEALQFAQAAMAHWGVNDAPCLIKNRENAVFEAAAPNGGKAALRLHRPGYQSDNSIRSELWWAEALVAGGMDVPVPVRTLADDVLAFVPEAGRMASLVTWCKGKPMGEGDVPLGGSEARQEALHHALGVELARLHVASDAALLPESFERPHLDSDALLGPNPAWGRFWENPSLTSTEVELLQDARIKLLVVFERYLSVGADFGLIHADALRENVMVDGDQVRLIDFDDGVFGFRMYELGVAMSQNWDQPNRKALREALLRGYASKRALPDDAKTLLDAFTVMRGLASCGWVIERYAPDAATTRNYAARAVEMVRRWV
ncbi:Ser/Thr protein kinase RdoA involved in Cpx stress response, MazF antagonist [Shimia gijangensis]|uniref:Ser/Thr protein kinase RdoA involved in Cpx stress response, MazF antagonist n=1 Tax=Shimia gijangensis TaxID=1470563 RepID=A0A1M6RQW2_9RHOB|nr:phosphotransferase [Shimia gijangensis]SHK34728.1 Ser/Thr protein kinase RdoA involved in Cpx stress response, MazF antagonist [Shimia gijangensis]